MSRTKKAQELKTITDLVKKLLEEIPECRESDDLLYMNIVNKVAPDALMMPAYLFFIWRKENNIPAFESVRRARQKVQAEYPELAGNDEVKHSRVQLQTVYKAYAQGAV